jgi:ligand-binding sensor domain-containing protein/serine phosphatase RsbU (regulator of sigma subunit)
MIKVSLSLFYANATIFYSILDSCIRLISPRMKRHLAIFFFLVMCNLLFAQTSQMRFKRISIDDGLSQVCVNHILQDKKGFMWFATQDGLNRYDGYTFTVYKPNPSNPNSLSNNVVKSLFEDNEGIIWIGTAGGGLNRFDPETETFTSYMYDPFSKTSLSNNDVYSIYEDTHGNFWVGTFGGGLNLFNKKTKTFKSYRHDPTDATTISGDAVRAITEDKNGNLWIGIDAGGLNRFNPQTGVFTRFPSGKYLSDDVVMSLYLDGNKLYIGTYSGGLNVFDINSHETKVYNALGDNKSLSSNVVWTIAPSNPNELFVGTRGGGLNIFDKTTETFTSYHYNPADASSISNMNIISIFKDRSGVVWFGTESAGVNKYISSGRQMKLLKNDRDNTNSLSNNNVFSIHEDSSSMLWIGTRGGGLNKYDPKTNTFKHIGAKDPGMMNILSFCKESNNKIWVGTDGNGFYLLDSTGVAVQHFRFDPKSANSISNNAISAITVDKDRILWIGTYGGGLNVYDQEQNRFRNFPIDRKNAMKNVVWCLTESRDGILWIGTGGHGLVRFDKETFRSVAFENSISDPSSISNDVVLSIFEDRDGEIWVGTGGGGINRFNRTTGTFKAYTHADGLCNDFVIGIVEDSHGNLWLSTYNGISRFDKSKCVFSNYYENDGLQGNTFNERSILKSQNGNLFFGGSNGLTFFHPDSLAVIQDLPQTVLTDLKIFNKSVAVYASIGDRVILEKPISFLDELVLSYKHSVFTIEFAALHYVAPNHNKYRYKMEGFDADWIETTAKNRIATYTNLGGGKYTFIVQAANSEGVWNENGRTLKIEIIPPFYKTEWFYTIVIVFVLISIYVFIRVRERQLLHANILLEDTVVERTQEINQQKEELKLQSELLARNNEDLSRSNSLITDSISYAKRIQEAVLPSIAEIQAFVPSFFIFYQPRDIVSGDFYWFAQSDDKIFIVVADCTGHGVPGAFMSMIGTTLLNDIIVEQKVKVPSEILEKLNIGVITALNQNPENAESQDDGMDISICVLDKKNGIVTVACANHTIHYVENGELMTIHGDIYSVGGIFSLESKREYTDHVIPYLPGTMLYMFTDGYQDQFGGPKGKKFLASYFRLLLQEIASKPVAQQRQILDTRLAEWKSDHKQVDDILVFGIHLV